MSLYIQTRYLSIKYNLSVRMLIDWDPLRKDRRTLKVLSHVGYLINLDAGGIERHHGHGRARPTPCHMFGLVTCLGLCLALLCMAVKYLYTFSLPVSLSVLLCLTALF